MVRIISSCASTRLPDEIHRYWSVCPHLPQSNAKSSNRRSWQRKILPFASLHPQFLLVHFPIPTSALNPKFARVTLVKEHAQHTIGVEFSSRTVKLGEKRIKLQVSVEQDRSPAKAQFCSSALGHRGSRAFQVTFSLSIMLCAPHSYLPATDR